MNLVLAIVPVVLGVLPFWKQLRRQELFQSAVWRINSGVVGLLLAALYDPIWSSAVKKPSDFAVALICFCMLQFWKLPNWAVVLTSCGLVELRG